MNTQLKIHDHNTKHRLLLIKALGRAEKRNDLAARDRILQAIRMQNERAA